MTRRERGRGYDTDVDHVEASENMLSGLKRRLFGAEATARMPERVAANIREERERGEILIDWVQFAGVLMFALAYSIGPKTFDPEKSFAPVP